MLAEVENVSASFLGRPYARGHLGEGTESRDADGRRSGRFDSHPLSDTERFDCTTFVEQVLAAAAARAGGVDAGQRLRAIRYRNGLVSYATRNHFAEADWLPNNIAAGLLRDITHAAAGGDIEARTAYKTISKSAWYRAKSEDDLEGPLSETLGAADKAALVAEWRALGAAIPDARVSLPYISVSDLSALLRQDAARVPSGSVVSIVRVEDPRMPVMVTHQGLLIRRDGRVYLRHARVDRQVVDSELVPYFESQAQQRWPILGINLALPLSP